MRPGRGGRFLCADCRQQKKGLEVGSFIFPPPILTMQCDKDDEDPNSSCSNCKKKGVFCGPRTLPRKRMESICGKIRDNRFTEIAKWAPKDQALLLKRLPPHLAARLSTTFNMPTPLSSRSNTDDSQRFIFPSDFVMVR